MDIQSLGGGEPSEIPADTLIESWQTNLYPGKKSFHLRSNHVTILKGDTASDFSKAYAINAIDEGDVTGIWEVWANYTYTLTKEGDEWMITGMSVFAIETRGDEAIRNYVPE